MCVSNLDPGMHWLILQNKSTDIYTCTYTCEIHSYIYIILKQIKGSAYSDLKSQKLAPWWIPNNVFQSRYSYSEDNNKYSCVISFVYVFLLKFNSTHTKMQKYLHEKLDHWKHFINPWNIYFQNFFAIFIRKSNFFSYNSYKNWAIKCCLYTRWIEICFSTGKWSGNEFSKDLFHGTQVWTLRIIYSLKQ